MSLLATEHMDVQMGGGSFPFRFAQLVLTASALQRGYPRRRRLHPHTSRVQGERRCVWCGDDRVHLPLCCLVTHSYP